MYYGSISSRFTIALIITRQACYTTVKQAIIEEDITIYKYWIDLDFKFLATVLLSQFVILH